MTGRNRAHRTARGHRQSPVVGYHARRPFGVAAWRGEGLVSIHAVEAPVTAVPLNDESLEFVRFCYRRRRVSWPLLYDEMCAVAARGAYRGLGFAELAERGVTFCLDDMPKVTGLLERIIAEERNSLEPSADPSSITLAMVPAQS